MEDTQIYHTAHAKLVCPIVGSYYSLKLIFFFIATYSVCKCIYTRINRIDYTNSHSPTLEILHAI